jgi:hypothetical protein
MKLASYAIEMSSRVALLLLALAALCGPARSLQAQTTATQSTGAASVAASSSTSPRGVNERLDRTLTAIWAVDASPRIDGVLDEPLWQMAEVADEFIQFSPNPGEAPSQKTEVRVLYTEDAIYVGARMFDTSPDSIISRLARRDEGAVTDEFLVAFDSYFDRRTAFLFMVSVAGVQSDLLVYDDVQDDISWNAVWDVATKIDNQGWTAEFRIPFSQLRFNRPTEDGSGTRWGVNFQREIARLGETSQWSPHPADRSRVVSAYGTLEGLAGIVPSKNLEIRPYFLGQATRAPGETENPFYNATDFNGSVGGDLRYGITNNITLNATINPDFGQVEADPSVVNLSAFETFFPERRPFFLEGVDIFEFNIGIGDQNPEQLFYTRRIGRRPQGFVSPGSGYTDFPEATTILGAAKISGKTSGGWSLGFLNALTGQEKAHHQTTDGEYGTTAVEPLTNYAVGRAIKDFNRGEPESNLFFLADAAYAGGIDFRHRFGGGNYQVSGYALGSHMRGNTDAISSLQQSSTHYYQRPDAPHVSYDPERRSLSGGAANLEIGRIGGGHWRYGFLGTARTPGFNVSTLGFQNRADEIIAVGYASYDQFQPQGIFRRWRLNTSYWSAWTFGAERLGTGGNVNTSFQLKNFWGGYLGIGGELPALSATALRGGPALRTPSEYNSFFGFFSDSRKTVRIGLNGNLGGDFETQTNRFNVSPNVTIQASSNFQLALGPGFSWRNSEWQYVSTRGSDSGSHFVFGRIKQTTTSLTARLNYTFSPKLSLQVYAQPFVSAGTYDQFKEVDQPRAAAFEDRFRRYSQDEISLEDGRYQVDVSGDGEADFSFGNPDFNVKQFRSNVVFRWEYRPGSTLFVVWSQDRSAFTEDGSYDLGRDVGDLFGAPATNVFLIKMEHWLGF